MTLVIRVILDRGFWVARMRCLIGLITSRVRGVFVAGLKLVKLLLVFLIAGYEVIMLLEERSKWLTLSMTCAR
jgi:hypothetical protein